MSETQETIMESASVIQEIEQQLEVLLPRKKEDIEKALAAKINQEKERSPAKRWMTSKRNSIQEREALAEFRTMVAEVEAERTYDPRRRSESASSVPSNSRPKSRTCPGRLPKRLERSTISIRSWNP